MNTNSIIYQKLRYALPALLCGMALSSLSLRADNGTWADIGSNGDWNTVSNWEDGVIAGGVGSIATITSPAVDGAYRGINLDGDVILGGLTYTALAQDGNYGWIIGSSGGYTLTLSTGTANAPIVNVRGRQTITAKIIGNQGFNKTNAGRLALYGNNEYTGITTLSGGSLYIYSSTALGATGVGNHTLVDMEGGNYPQLHFNNVTTSEDIIVQLRKSDGAAGATVASNLIYNDGGNTTLNGSLTFNRVTTGGANNINTIGIQVSAGTLTINGAINGSLTGNQASGTYADPNRLQFRLTSATSQAVVNGTISDGTIGNGGLSVYIASDSNVGSTLVLAGVNTYTGNTVISTGNFELADTGSLVFDISKANQLKLSTGAGALIEGTFNVNFGDVSPTEDATVKLVTVSGGSSAPTYGSTFVLNINGTSSETLILNAANNYQSSNALGNWTFNCVTGDLNFVAGVIPEPASLSIILGLSTLAIIVMRRQ